ncbi:DUF5076 domain-containing protein [Alterisphingorhabdus coralli]|uniref:DUF5076 domain-containing protein n=1 Tax=Alterisphingorhabdus coralli TaxID=3071408 RepID=A0AA97FA22_9SPHN|nr:DUF5076 domain-containing protein [Parasphingorhabdus sp. SCSIO 66989]WOE76027.1 DUF5076 domain-containing protein [Parasphingorhabdus sp. SCSIO 66989]
MASTGSPAGAINLDGLDILDNSAEVARLWVENNGPATCIINPTLLEQPEMFGLLMVDCVRHAARAYAQAAGMTEVEALARIWNGVDMERESHTTGLTTLEDGSD